MRLAILALGILTVLAPAAMAQDCEAPCAGTNISLELKNDWIFAADPFSLESKWLQPEIEFDSFLLATSYLKFVSVNKVEQVIDPAPGASSTFENLGLYTSELYAALELDPLTIRAGKIEPVFSLANDVAHGMNAADLASNADVVERLGAELALAFDAADLKHMITGSAFTLDRSFLARSYFTSRHVPKLSDGGAGNTSGISSFAAVLAGCKGAEPGECYTEGEFGYHLGVRHQRAGQQTEEEAADDIIPQSETALLGAIHGNIAVGERTLRLIGEGAHIKHFEGSPDDATILTSVAALVDGPFIYSVGAAQQWNSVAADADTQERLLDLSIKYAPEDSGPFPGSSWSVETAYTFAEDAENQTAHMLSLHLALEFGKTYEFR